MERRDFIRCLAGSSALSIAALDRANAAIYQNIKSLSQKIIEDNSPDGVYWDSIRKHYLFEDDLIMMNNGTVGPTPAPVLNTLIKAVKVQATCPYDCYNYFPNKKNDLRPKLAKFLNASPEEIAINRNTTEGMNVAAHGLDLKAGDEVLISSHEHPAGIQPWRLIEKKKGIVVKEVVLNVPSKSVEEIVLAFEKAITEKTRVISVSHTVFITGLILPVKELTEMAHKHNIIVIVDSAHGLGMLDLDLHDLGVDVFCTSPYKWLGAPTGCGVLYVRKEVQDQILPLIASSGWDTEKSAKRYETLSQRNDALIFAFDEALEFQKSIGKKRIERRIKTLATYLREELEKLKGVRLHTSKDLYLSAGLTAFSIRNVDAQFIVDYLREKYNIVIRTIGRDRDHTRGVRASTHIFVSQKDVDLLVEGVAHLAKQNG